MKRVVVSGGSGFLGSHIADELTRQGYDVTIFDRQRSPYLQPSQKMVLGDVRDADTVKRALEGADYVYHLAGLADLNAARSRPVDTAALNILGTLNFLEASRAVGVKRLLFASTVYVYSREGSFYRCSKQACEEYIEEYRRSFGLPYTILRYGSLYGPRAGEVNGVYRLLVQAAQHGRIRHVGTPDDVREYIHVEDAARLSVRALSEECENQHVTLTGHHPMRLRDLFTMFGEILGREIPVDYVQLPEGQLDGHYRITPYAFSPRVGRKLTTNLYVDMGQGILQILEEMHHDVEPEVYAISETEMIQG